MYCTQIAVQPYGSRSRTLSKQQPNPGPDPYAYRVQYRRPVRATRKSDRASRVGRRRRASATGFYSEGGTDFSSGLFEGNSLVVEGRPRDGGFTIETYTLESGGNRLRIEMTIQPDSFREPIELVRYFDRAE